MIHFRRRPEKAERLHALTPSSGAEEVVYQLAVRTGVLEIDEQGRIWRVRRRDGRHCHRQRAESITRRPRRHAMARPIASVHIHVRVGDRLIQRSTSPQRLVWLHFFGPIPPGMVVQPRDDQSDSQRPDDLVLLPHAARATRRERRNPNAHSRGDGHPQAKLTADLVLAMRHARAKGATTIELSRRFGVSFNHIARICSGEFWSHVGGPRSRGNARSRTKFHVEPERSAA